jgi:hypothetical protein
MQDVKHMVRRMLVVGGVASALALSAVGPALADSPFDTSCEAGHRPSQATSGLKRSAEASSAAPTGGTEQGKEKSSEFSEINFCPNR